MVRFRKLVLAIAAASALSSGMAHALGLGEVTLKSALNQPLVAEIELLEVRDLATNEVLPNLASPEEFNKAGVDRQFFLNDLKFTPVIKPNGKSVIRVTSSKPVREPYVNFLVEVLWPNGRLLREYTLLLDPPLYAPQSVVPAPQAPAVASAPRAPAAAPAPRPAASASAPAASASSASSALQGSEYKTTANDTLWEIAQRVGGASVHQTMLAIQDLNPNAFIGGNINRLKNNQVLRLPDEQQIKSRSRSEAIAQVAEQNSAWREGRGVAASTRQLDATKRATAGAAPAEAKTKDSLKLVAADAGKATKGSDTGAANGKALADKLAVTQESLDSTRRENEELKSRMGDLQGQLDKLQRLIQLKDDQMAKLQADLAAPAKAPAATPPAVKATPPEVKATPPAPAKAAAPAPAAPKAEEPKDFNYSEDPVEKKPDPAANATTQQPATKPAEVVKPAPVVAAPPKPAAKPKPVVVAEEPVQPSMLDDLLANPMLLGVAGGGALLLLLIGLMMLSRRNALKEAELQEQLAAGGDEDTFAANNDMPADSFDSFPDELSDADGGVSEERLAAQAGDALGEADIYIAYGRFSQAAELLQNAINEEPQRSDLRLKLMEVYAELGDRDGFARQERELTEIGGVGADIAQLKSKYPAVAASAGAGLAAAADTDMDSFSLDDLTLDDPVPSQPAQAAGAEDLDDAFDLSLDDLESELERDLQASSDSADMQGLSLDDDLSLDFDEPASPAAKTESKEDDLDFSLALDEAVSESPSHDDDLAGFSLDLDEPGKPASPAEDEFLLSLDDEPQAAADDGLADLDLDVVSEETENDFDLPAEFDLSAEEQSSQAPAQPSADSFAAQLDEVTAELDQLSAGLDLPLADERVAEPASASLELGESDDDFDFLSGTDETATKLDLARAYIDMGDTEGARDILDEVIAEGSEGQQQEARELIGKLS
nr:FimV/HubP family polar landmark protein [uncultured Pseudomonas sp.]